MPAVCVSDLVITHGGKRAVDGLSFTADAGEVVALVGPNGAGKTSTVEACVGLRRYDGGLIETHGRIGVMLQDGGLYPTARPLEFVRHVAGLYAHSENPSELLAALGIDPATRTTIRRLSGGEQQRVKCAAALVGRPELVFLDEPTAGLDSAGRRTFHDLVRDLTGRGTTVVLTTHLMDDVERLADQIVVVDRGRDLHHGSVSDLVGDSDTIWVRLPTGSSLDALRSLLSSDTPVDERAGGVFRITARSDPGALSTVATWCAQNGVPTSGLTVGRRSLEDAVQALLEEQQLGERQ